MALNETTKIATCCYCGARSVLQLRARDGHELACGRCGAPLHEMKAMPVARAKTGKSSSPRKGAVLGYSTAAKRAQVKQSEAKRSEVKPGKSRSKSKSKKKKGFGYWIGEALEEAFEEIVDIFD